MRRIRPKSSSFLYKCAPRHISFYIEQLGLPFLSLLRRRRRMCAIALLPSSLLQNTPYDCSTFSFSKRREDNSDESIKREPPSASVCAQIGHVYVLPRPITQSSLPEKHTHLIPPPPPPPPQSVSFPHSSSYKQPFYPDKHVPSPPFPFRSSHKRGHSFSKK